MPTLIRVTVEIEKDGKVRAAMTESEWAGGGLEEERALGILLSIVLGWARAREMDDLLVLAMISSLSGWETFQNIGVAYNKWSGTHDFSDGVKVVVDDAINQCDGKSSGECKLCSGETINGIEAGLLTSD